MTANPPNPLLRLWKFLQCLWHASAIGWWIGRVDKVGSFRVQRHAERLRALGWSDDEIKDMIDRAS